MKTHTTVNGYATDAAITVDRMVSLMRDTGSMYESSIRDARAKLEYIKDNINSLLFALDKMPVDTL